MKYFAKELPIECPQLAKQPEGSSCNRNNSCTYPKCTKKLFLCSRDIQVGDKVRDKTGKEFEFTNDVAKFPKYQDLVFKAIGEISPEAIFVREGFEFEEDEVRNLYIRREGRREFLPISAKVSINSSK